MKTDNRINAVKIEYQKELDPVLFGEDPPKMNDNFKYPSEEEVPTDLILEAANNLAKKERVVYVKGVLTYANKLNGGKKWYKYSSSKDKIIDVLRNEGCMLKANGYQMDITALYEPVEGDYDTRCIVYVVGSEERDVYKVGYSSNLKRRVQKIQQGLPFEIDLICRFEKRGRKFEREIHRELREYNIRGEWFKIELRKLGKILTKNFAHHNMITNNHYISPVAVIREAKKLSDDEVPYCKRNG